MYLAKIYVSHKKSILDPQGEAIKSALHRLNYNDVNSITQGKYFITKLDSQSKSDADQTVRSICKDLLVNQNMETYQYELKEV
ncbi:phosphoribosylformylglycinamidine synthase subunit PurS [Philodulcilactobacillus myokoensis]|uniref:Phosphoribosylformylglycinamidine synthase subunit PurS n=1 Tax=Philodulcilactobacillus myokoensis TaxID=2929573 RepID=A0A9W6EUI1_9LACO|nr:phosphoribosylformylglycinamidine synthase subunit PurS [Philodulcilactobacillus myokoensis]GLB47454.1 phosphoribosylformylglycinamidine synthase subunit PurS [Philodulcilactobacillus myokoensis]